MDTETYRVIPSLTPPRSSVALAKRHSRIEDAFAAMGDGVVVGVRDDAPLRLVAFHERHMPMALRTNGAVLVGR